MDFMRKDGRCVLVAMDQGVTMGVVEGLENIEEKIKITAKSGADGLILTYGTAKRYNGLLKELDIPFILRCDHFTSLISIRPPETEGYSMIADIDEANELGASAVILYLIFGMNSAEATVKNFETVAGFSDACSAAGLPLCVESVLWGRNLKKEEQNSPIHIRNACRISAELGADIIRAPYTGSRESFEDVLRGCYAPVVISGWIKSGDESETLKNVKDAIDAGAMGVVSGRSLWQSGDPLKMLERIKRIVHI